MQNEEVKSEVEDNSSKLNIVVENSTMASDWSAEKIDELKHANSIDETTKITSLNPDCMEFIFNYLDLYDLLSVADSSKTFYNPVCQIYKRKFIKFNPIFDETRSYWYYVYNFRCFY